MSPQEFMKKWGGFEGAEDMPGDLESLCAYMQKRERERCAKKLEDGSFFHQDAPDARWARAAAKAIRGMES